MRIFHRSAGAPVALLLGCGALLCAVECRDGTIDPKAARAKWKDQEREMAELQAKAWVKRWLVGELIEGRLSLTQATDEFMKFQWAGVKASEIRRVYPGADERESMARYVIAYAKSEIEWKRDLTPEQHLRVLERLDAELRGMCK